MSSVLFKKDRYRIVVMGAAKVGKSAIISRFMFENFVSEYKATVEEFYQGEFVINGLNVTLDILDTAGAYDFPAMRKLSISTGDAFVLVYSVEDEDSFNEVNRLREQILEQKGSESLTPIVIVGNKTDLPMEKRAIQKELAETTANLDWDSGYVEVSAKDDVNIYRIFRELLVQARVQLDSDTVVRKRRVSESNASNITKQKKQTKKLSKQNSCTIA